MKLWRMAMRVGTGGESLWPLCNRLGVAAITYLPICQTDLTDYHNAFLPERWQELAAPQKTSLRRLVFEIAGGDIIYVKEGPNIVGRGTVRGISGVRAYQYAPNLGIVDPNGTPWPHTVPVDWDQHFQAVTVQIGKSQIFTVEGLDEEFDVQKLDAAQRRQAAASGSRSQVQLQPPFLDIEIPNYPAGHHPFNVSDKPDYYTPAKLLEMSESQTARMDFFIKNLVAIYWVTSEPVPYVFRTRDGKIRSLDAGCLGSLAHRTPPDVTFNLDSQGIIESVVPSSRRLELYEPLRARLIGGLGTGKASGETLLDAGSPSLKPEFLSVSAIVSRLEGNGFASSSTAKVMRFVHSVQGQVVYVKVPGEGRDHIHCPFVFHPELPYAKPAILDIDGMVIDPDWYHLSNLNDFPVRLHGGNAPTHFGIAVDFKNASALEAFLIQFAVSPANNHAISSGDPLTGEVAADLAQAKDDLDSAETVTERTSLVKARVGQGKFRDDLIAFWGGCAITAVKSHGLLKASHIKPWRLGSNLERLDKFNGLLLTPNLDHAFDAGLISFADNGTILISPHLTKEEAAAFGVSAGLKLKQVKPAHLPYLEWHRTHEFKMEGSLSESVSG